MCCRGLFPVPYLPFFFVLLSINRYPHNFYFNPHSRRLLHLSPYISPHSQVLAAQRSSQCSSTMVRSISVLFIVLLVGVTNAALAPQEYWKAMLPGTPMPTAIRELLRPGMGVRHKGFGVQGCSFSYSCSFKYGKSSASADKQMADMPHEDVFFLQKDLLPGAKMTLDFTRRSTAESFIPREEASTIPFSSEKLPDLLARFTVQPNSVEAQAMKETLQECEEKDPSEESKYCATSLESMVDFATSALRTREILAVSSEVAKGSTAKLQDYTVASSPMQRLPGSSTVACHPKPWPYALYYCHVTPATRAYVVWLVGKDGSEVEAVAVCHDDTSAWSPTHLAFQLLKVKPGTLPICHFLPKDNIIWATRRSVAP